VSFIFTSSNCKTYINIFLLVNINIMIAIVGFITVVLVSAVAIYNYVSYYDNNKKIDGKIASAENKAKLATEMEHQEHTVELDKVKTEVGVDVLKARREADGNLKSATRQLRNELNQTSKTLNKTMTDYVLDILRSIGLSSNQNRL
jgi:F0F1-type ATP synthase membrane subunit b/b'